MHFLLFSKYDQFLKVLLPSYWWHQQNSKTEREICLPMWFRLPNMNLLFGWQVIIMVKGTHLEEGVNKAKEASDRITSVVKQSQLQSNLQTLGKYKNKFIFPLTTVSPLWIVKRGADDAGHQWCCVNIFITTLCSFYIWSKTINSLSQPPPKI